MRRYFLPLIICLIQNGVCLSYTKSDGLPVFRNSSSQFGSPLCISLIERMVGEPIIAYQTETYMKKLLAFGSILTMAKDGDVIWGTGINGIDLDLYKFSTLDIRAILGPLSREFIQEQLNIPCPEVYGDPRLLLPYFFPEFVKKENPSQEYIIIPPHAERDPWDEIIEKILDSKFVISSSLHGIVVAESFGIPARLLRSDDEESLFKYQDYYLGTGRPNFTFAKNIEEALQMGGEKPPVCDLQKLYASFPFDYWPFATAKMEKLTMPKNNSFSCQFVLHSKQIRIDSFPGGFNPSIIRWKEGYLLAFRNRFQMNHSIYRIGIVPLDKNFNPSGPVYELNTPYMNPNYPVREEEDPRLIAIGEKLLLVYNNDLVPEKTYEIRRMFIGELSFEKEQLVVGSIEGPLTFPGEMKWRQEKNWTPFEYQGQLLLSYSLAPHRVLLPCFGTHSCVDYSISAESIKWDYGELRGGTPACLIGDRYLSFFHSSMYLEEKQTFYYYMGAYTFSATPPFEILEISPHPIIGAHFYTGPSYNTRIPLRVVFPSGFVFDEEYIWVACGKQDNEMWIYKLDRQGLLDSLVPKESPD